MAKVTTRGSLASAAIVVRALKRLTLRLALREKAISTGFTIALRLLARVLATQSDARISVMASQTKNLKEYDLHRCKM